MKNNGTLWKIIAVVAGICIAVAGVISAYGGRNRDIKDNTKRLDKHEVKINELEKAVIEQTTHYGHIKETLEKMEKKL